MAAALALVLTAFVQALLPGLIFAESINYFSEGSIRCYHDLGLDAFVSSCHAFGEPTGFPLFTGGPLVALGVAFMYVPGLDSLGALTAAQLAFQALALAGAFGLMRRLGAGPWVALGTATAWGLSPTVLGLEGFGGTAVGFALLPAFAFLDLVVMHALEAQAGWRRPLLAAFYGLVRTAALFMDGYSFIASALVGACLWTAWLLARDTPGRRRAAGIAVLLGANLVAVGVYSAYVPLTFTTDPIETFRAMGLDVKTLVLPSQYIWWASKFGLAVDHGARLWGDTTNALWNYAGFIALALATWYLVRRWRDRLTSALAVAGVVALVLSFGPAFKVDVARPPGPAAVYVMPKGQAPELPWARLFVDLPGLKSMRATYRWYAVTRMVLIVLAGLAIAAIARGPGRRRQLLALLLAAAALVEVLPTVPFFVRVYRDRYEDRAQVKTEVVGDLDRATRRGERVFFLNYDGAHNDFLANYLASAAELRSYNVGGDKNVGYAMSRWPNEIRALSGPGVRPDAVERALRSRKVDVVVAPFFHLLINSGIWPPAPETRLAAETAFRPILRAPGLEVRRYARFATIRLRDGQSP